MRLYYLIVIQWNQICWHIQNVGSIRFDVIKYILYEYDDIIGGVGGDLSKSSDICWKTSILFMMYYFLVTTVTVWIYFTYSIYLSKITA